MESRFFIAPEQLEAFEAAARSGSFSAAARSLGKAQSTVSGLISNLEIDTGLTLFDRSGREPKLTAQGRSLLHDVRSLLNSYSRFEAKSRSLNAGLEESLTIAVDESAIDLGQLVQSLDRFYTEFGTVSVSLLHASGESAAALVREGKADVGIVLSQSDYPEDFDFRGVGSCSFVLVSGKSHSLAALEKVSIQDLHNHLHLRISANSDPASLPENDLSDRIWYLESYSLCMAMLTAGLGWAFAPLHIARPYIESGAITVLNTDFQLTPYPYCTDLIWSRRKTLGPAGRRLIDEISHSLSTEGTEAA
ncbi:LysR family transcriptional regulator [Microbulbifer hydrolyticus]|uniref:DNA-binding transcriptional LysR family regulator n=1 Tax=Microbulbifer hydrolyticus TaxID=48074 RepID=A0A6P1TAI0_9GAMM|nr:LysR family transcriptional regulator [Microbulbifer hydrolyticus]MBB5210778.1 DNA-binding transcriptional LysR family regulator [Microbulbifer hydrolyticus]QHQ38781.1 LysR family transcriptional regulator [Microbulbifer hydrolyticus]